jgi:hypothetical protein
MPEQDQRSRRGRRARLKTVGGAVFVAAAVSWAGGQTPPIYTPVGAPQVTVPAGPPVLASVPAPIPQYTPAQIDQLTASIALYPDPLLASMLAAATFPNDLVAAAQWSALNPAPNDAQIDVQTWDPSVKVLLHYPAVLAWMAQNIQWTQTLGTAFVNQQADVFGSVQRLRAAALAAGSLVSTPEQQVVVNGGVVQILPAAPGVLFVPVYDPLVVYVRPVAPRRAVIAFGAGVRFGAWLDFDLDWHEHHIIVGVGHELPVAIRREGHPEVRVEVAHPAPQVWVRNPGKPLPVPPHVIVQAPPHDEHHGWAPPVEADNTFGGYGHPQDALQAEQRGRDHGQDQGQNLWQNQGQNHGPGHN